MTTIEEIEQALGNRTVINIFRRQVARATTPDDRDKMIEKWRRRAGEIEAAIAYGRELHRLETTLGVPAAADYALACGRFPNSPASELRHLIDRGEDPEQARRMVYGDPNNVAQQNHLAQWEEARASFVHRGLLAAD